MKGKRQATIIEIIKKYDVETQEELREKLLEKGIDVKQSTLSRDIKELRIIKVLSKNKRYKYAISVPDTDIKREKLLGIFSNSILSIEKVDKFVVIKTLPGSASAAAEMIDQLDFFGIAGTIAGDNTIFILLREEEEANKLVEEIHKIIND
ncbi:arginine repressor [Oceanirhabdus sp. W0125-5]|uniref:arginine repressor n=1 Tax=Oceanirhabdus sp. W0125-5 TaxID=2999116 RepID=UPI0022F2F415|nr:arginine repressor [Oceanirhabdus sp. W0125-5]WBW95318.1 arginine repressor [Oceanirhabdus sp. W0125-5]